MQVSSGATWNTVTDMRRIDIGFNDDDGIALTSKSKWDALSHTEKLRTLQMLADLAVIQYMRENGGLDDDNALLRFKEIKTKLSELLNNV